MGTVATTIYQSSDLNQRGRAILDAAREGLVRVRDKDGASLVMAREERFDELRRGRDVGSGIAHVAANFMVIEQAVTDRPDVHPRRAEMGDWVWLRHLPVEDLKPFIDEMRDALYQSFREYSVDPVDEALDAWRETALALRDPLSRETLLTGNDDDEYIEADRPEPAAATVDRAA